MQDVINWAVRKLQDIRERHAGTLVKIGETYETSVELLCTSGITATQTSGNEMQQQSQHAYLIFRTSDLEENDLIVSRNLFVWLDGKVYTATMRGRNIEEYNDTISKLETVINVVEAGTYET